jgi:asparagine synthase (glutamine-hydrolysing)
LLSELTKRHVTVALCGDGGDEVFAGYERFAAALALGRYDRLPAPARWALREVVGHLPPKLLRGRESSVRRFMALSGMSLPEAMLAMVAYVPLEGRVALVGKRADDALEPYLEVWRRSEGASPLDRLCRLNIDTYLLDDLLPKVDRMSMAHGLEVRAPLLDREVMELGMSLPARTKVRGLSLKRVLKLAVADLLPPEILHRRKRWFRTDLRKYAEAMLCSPGSRVRNFLHRDGLDALVDGHMSGRDDAGNSLWTLLTLEVFLRREDW